MRKYFVSLSKQCVVLAPCTYNPHILPLILMFSSGLEIFSTFNPHHPVAVCIYGCPFHVCFNWQVQLLLTIALAVPVRPADKRHPVERNVI